MRKHLIQTVWVIVLVSLIGQVYALNVDLYVDAAPNIYGSPNWAPWWTDTKQDVVSGAMTNMQSGTFPGTTTIDPIDEIVYSTGDLGTRLHWIYWMPETSVQALQGLFEVKWVVDWDGVAYSYDWNTYSMVVDDPDSYWSQPTRWENYNNGVIGSFGFAWWAADNDALPLSSDANLYNETNAADIEAIREEIFTYQTYARGMVRYRDSQTAEWQYTTLQVNIVPEPTTLILLGGGLLGLVVCKRKNRK